MNGKAIGLICRKCGRIKHYQKWETIATSGSDFFRLVFSKGLDEIKLLATLCPTCKVEVMNGLSKM